MKHYSKFFAASLLAVVAATASHAATLDLGSFTVVGAYATDDADPVDASSNITIGGTIILPEGDYSGLVSFGSGDFTLGDPSSGSFTGMLGTETLTFTVTGTQFFDIDSAASGSFDIAGYLSVTGDEGSTGLASFLMSASSLSASGGYSMYVETPPVDYAPTVPLPAGVFLLGGALGALGIARRKSA